MSDEIFFDGVRYILAAEAGKGSGLTRDYISRLCREGKIKGKQVGKIWYVEHPSLQAFLSEHKQALDKQYQALAEQRAREYRDNAARALLAKARAMPKRAHQQYSPSHDFISGHGNVLASKKPSSHVREQMARAVVSKSAIMPGVGDAALRLAAHTPAALISPTLEFLHKLTALVVALSLTLGTYAMVDTKFARFAEETVQSSVAYAGNPGQIASLGGNIKSQLAAAALDPSGTFVGMMSDLARSLNTNVDRFVYAIAFSDAGSQPSDYFADPAVRGTVAASVSPYSPNGVPTSSPRAIATNTEAHGASSTTIINNPVVERIVQTERIVSAGGISEDILNRKLQQLDNKLTSQMFSLSAANSTATAQNYQVIAQTNKIDQLTNTHIYTPTISGGSLADVTISATSLSVSGATSLGNFTAAIGTLATGIVDTLTSTLATITNLTATNLVATNATTTNATTTALYVSGLAQLATLNVSGSSYVTGGLGIGVATTTAGVLQTSGDARIGGNLTVIGNSTTLGASSADSLVVNSSIKSNLVPDQNITYDLGSASFYWKNLYVGTLTANSISAASTTIGGTQSNTFTLNSDNTSQDAEDSTLIFFRGTVVPNALLTWNSATSSKRFEFNQSLYISNQSGSTTQPTLALRGVAGQTGNIVDIASSTGDTVFSVGSDGAVTIATSTITSLTAGTTTLTNLAVTNTSTSTFAGGLTIGSSQLVLQQATGRIGIGTTTPASIMDIFAVDALRIPVGNTAQRPTQAGVGQVRYNITTHQFEGYGDNTVWQGLGGVINAAQTSYITAGTDDFLRFVTNSAEKMTITDTGNVGIGTTSPDRLLTLYSATTPSLGLSAGLTGNNQWTMGIDTADGYKFKIASSTAVGTNPRLTIDGSGNVGIGDTSPASKLTVNGDIRIKAGSGGSFYFSDGTFMTSAGVGTASGVSSASDVTVVSDSDANGSGDIVLKTGATDRFHILNNGNIGISNTAPLYRLSIYSTNATDNLLQVATSTNTSIFVVNSSGYVGVGTTTPAQALSVAGKIYTTGGIQFPDGSLQIAAAAGAAAIGSGTTGQFPYYAAAGQALTATSALFLTASGNIGIGTTTPNQLLSLYSATTPSLNFSAASAGQWTMGIDTADGSKFKIASSTAVGTNARLTIDGNGNVGIGTTTPGSLLSLSGIANFTTATSTFYSTGGINLTAGCFSIGGTCLTSGSGSLTGTTGQLAYFSGTNTAVGTSTLFVSTAGNVGIGTTSPLSLLDVYGNLSLSGTGRYLNFGATSTSAVGTNGYGIRDNAGVIEFRNSGGVWNSMNTATSGPSFLVKKGGSDQTVSAGVDTLVTWPNEVFDTNNNFANNRFTPTVAGKYIVTAAIHCDAATVCNVYIYKNGSLFSRVISNGQNDSAINTTIVDMNGTTDYVEAWAATTGGTTFNGSGNVSYFTGALIAPVNATAGGWQNDGTQSFLADSTDLVGIGTAAPAYKLDVNGSINATSLYVNGVAVGTGGGGSTASSTRQVLLSGTSATYTTPAGAVKLIIRMRGGGSGGSGSGTSGVTNGNAGVASVFNGISAAGGGVTNTNAGIPGAGGTGGAGAASVRIAGAPGQGQAIQFASGTNYYTWGGAGGGAGGGTSNGAAGAGIAGIANSGGGGSGGGTGSLTFATGINSGVGGGEGEYAEVIINSPASTYTYTVGAGGTGGTAGTSGTNGGAGGSGYIIVDEYYDTGTVNAGTAGQIPVYSSAGNILSATSSLFIATTTGSIGIGSTSPATTLSVAGSGYFTGGLGVGALNTATGTISLAGTTGTSTIAAGQGFTIGTSQFVLQQGSGRVGIGTASPSTRLHLVDSSTNFPLISFTGSSAADSFIGGDGATSQWAINRNPQSGTFTNASAAGASIAMTTASTNSYITFSTSQTNNIAPTEAMRITKDGYLGLGVSAPAAMLDVYSPNTVNAFHIANSTNSNRAMLTVGTVVNDTNLSLYNAAGTLANYFTTNGASYVNGGNFGVGTTSPYAKFSIHANSGETNTTLFAIASSTASATSTLFSILNTGIVSANAIIPNGTYTNNLAAYDLGATGSRWNALWAGTLNVGTSTFSISSDSASNLGIFTAASGGGTQALTITSGGNVGIGTTSPATLLSIAGSGYFTGGLGVGALNTTAGTINLAGTTGTTTIATGQGFTIGSSQFVVQQGSGNVGIGTASPAALFSVAGNGYFTGNVGIGVANTGGAALAIAKTGIAEMADFFKTDSTTGTMSYVVVGQAAATGRAALYGFIDNTDTVSGGAFVGNIGDSAPTGLFVKKGGNVGIGTTGPLSKFHVLPSGTGVISASSDSLPDAALFEGPTNAFTSIAGQVASNVAIVSNSALATGAGGTLALGGKYTGNSFADFAMIKGAKENLTDGNYAGYLAFGTHTNGGGLSERMRISSAGNVGIGITTVQYPLQVASPYAKTDTSARNGPFFGSNEIDYPFGLSFLTTGGASNSVRYSELQTTETGLAWAGNIRMQPFGGNVLIVPVANCNPIKADATGLLNCSSDERLKDIQSQYTTGLAAIDAINPIIYNWKANSGLTNTVPVLGFSAQNVQSVIPLAVTTDTRGYLQLDQESVLAAGVNAIKELDSRTSFISSASTSTVLTVDALGNIGIGTTTPQHRLQVAGDVAAEAFVNNSSRSLKTDITTLSTTTEDTILTQLQTTNVYTYRYKDEPDTNPLRMGLIVDSAPTEVLSSTGDGVDVYKLAAFTLAGVKAQSRQIEALNTRVGVVEQAIADIKTALTGQAANVASSASAVSLSLSQLLDGLKSLGVDIAQNLAHFVKIIADNLQVGSAAHPTGITMYDKTTGQPYCFQVDNGSATTTAGACTDIIIQTASAASATASSSSSTSTDTEAPVITLNGNNPATINIGTTYGDLGAIVTDNVSQNLGLYASVGGGATTTPELITLDTSTTTTYTIFYSATDQAGNTGTATRTVNVVDPNPTTTSPTP